MTRRPQHAQQGVVLIVVLIMLVIIGLSSAAVMRNALEADMISANVRSENLATEAAQAALAFCEQQITNLGITPRAPSDAADHTEHWQNLANWSTPTPITGAGPYQPTSWAANRTSGSALATATANSKAPECMAEYVTIGTSGFESIARVTARGFTPDYTEDTTTHQPVAGSAVWLQSTLRLQ